MSAKILKALCSLPMRRRPLIVKFIVERVKPRVEVPRNHITRLIPIFMIAISKRLGRDIV